MTIGGPGTRSPQGDAETEQGGWSGTALVSRFDGDELLARELVALFLVECPRMMAAVRDGVQHGIADDVRRAAHALKGSMSNFTDQPPVTTAFALEQQGASGCLTDAPATLAQLEREVADLLAAMRRFERT
jgi:HPt (histidine-containing phosphotransfer) domain-containing protein